MLDIKYIRQNPDRVKKGCQSKNADVDIDYLLEIDAKRREAIQGLEDIRAKKNKVSREIPLMKDEHEKKKILLEMKEIDSNSDRLEA